MGVRHKGLRLYKRERFLSFFVFVLEIGEIVGGGWEGEVCLFTVR